MIVENGSVFLSFQVPAVVCLSSWYPIVPDIGLS